MNNVEDAIAWLLDTTKKCHFGDVTITLIVHDGTVTRIEYGNTNKAVLHAN